MIRQTTRALALLALGAFGSVFVSKSAMASQGDEYGCSGCIATLDAALIEFITYFLPTGSSCSFRHNFYAWDGYCEPYEDGCEEYPCTWLYFLECIGECSSEFESGTIWFTPNGPLAAPVPCNTVQLLPPVNCGSSLSTMHYGWTTITQSGTPQLQTRFNKLTCTPCYETVPPLGTI